VTTDDGRDDEDDSCDDDDRDDNEGNNDRAVAGNAAGQHWRSADAAEGVNAALVPFASIVMEKPLSGWLVWGRKEGGGGKEAGVN
jgi:hypothetical protein